MNVLDLCSGIGGFSLGLERAGMRTVAFCERDEWCRAVLRKHWPDVPCFDDIRTVNADGLDRLGRIDLICGGIPCQPFSVAGKQEGQADTRYLWPAMRGIIALCRPSWIIVENVTGIIPLALDDLLFDLEGLEYATRPFVIPACAVDAKHRRDRVWVIAHATRKLSHGRGHERNRRTEPTDSCARSSTDPECRGQQGPRPSRDASYTKKDRQGKATQSWDGRIRHIWSPEPSVGRVATGVPHRVDRLRALGNAVVPQVVEEIGRAIMQQVTSSGEHS